MRLNALLPRSHRLYVGLNIVGFAFALTTVLFIGMYAARELTMNMFHRDADRIYKISGWGCPYPLAPVIEAGVPDFEAIGNVGRGPYLEIRRPEAAEGVVTNDGSLQVDPAFFRVFSFRIVRGDRENPLPDVNSVVLTESMAKALFGNEDPIGQNLVIQSRPDWVVTAVTEDIPINSSIRYSVVLPLNPNQIIYNGNTLSQDWNRWQYEIFGKVRPGADIAAVNAKMQQVVEANGNLGYEVERVVCYPLSDVYFNYADLFTAFKGGNHKQVVAMIWVGIIILLLGIVNFFNLSTAQGTLRAKEIGLRKVNGATRGHLILRSLAESIFMTFIALVLAIVLVDLLLPFFNGIVGFPYPLILMNQWWQWAILLGLTFGVGIIAGSYPAFYLSSLDPIDALYTHRAGRGNGMLLFRKTLIVVQLIASIGVIVSTLVIYGQLRHLQTKDLGFDKEQIVLINMDMSIYEHRQAFFSELRQLPFVQSISLTQGIVGNYDSGGPLEARYQEEKKKSWSKVIIADSAFFTTFGIDMAQGDPKFRDGVEGIVLNESAMNAFQVDDYEQLRIQDESGDDPSIPTTKVDGVCRNFHFKPLKQGIEPLAIYIQPIEGGLINVRVEASSVSDIRHVFNEIEAIYRKFNAADPLYIRLLDEMLAQIYISETRFLILFTLFSVLAILISCFGLFGLIVFSNARRRKEIGIRKVQGATILEVVFMLIRSYLIYVGIAFVVAVPLAWYLMRDWLSNYPYRITLHPGYFLIGGAVVLFVVVLTVGIQSWIAARANPVRSLRSE